MLVSEQGFREDGRKPKELRRVEARRRMVGDEGIVEIRQGNTQVSAACRGSREVGKISIGVEFYVVSRQEPINERRALEYEGLLLDIFSSVLLPEGSADIKVIVREDGGSLLSAMINCITLCLSYFGIPLRDMCYSATVSEGCIDLTSTEESLKTPVVTVAYLMNKKNIAYLSLNGRIVQERLQSSILEGVDACHAISKCFKDFFSPCLE
ncbi:ribonuclease [Encephalitozoon intestinalis ATCC 50506]|uniref:Ribonuclease n=1 Tax=Encephalitozoon intestinalis (strain ATCC 50506) TaxID=876142 RepID=E0S9E4_ENCIT|nr:ribonuclease [Encephalitozoon intestinalis ATCC 50506]ADM12208.1 ribonuclease [Encephalitozoon intestinalis ATCC 50506]UTX46015.1 exosome RNA binding protein RRP41 [Encephalitozoon intestinalis]